MVSFRYKRYHICKISLCHVWNSLCNSQLGGFGVVNVGVSYQIPSDSEGRISSEAECGDKSLPFMSKLIFRCDI
jgi:hypothetical protein